MKIAAGGELADARSRRAARLELGRSLIVEAGAGTGKTTLLVERMLFLMLGGMEGGADPLAPERLVALTFTERAAAEIKSRLALRLDRIAAGLQAGAPVQEDEELLRDLESGFARSRGEVLALASAGLRGLGRAQIGTIHSFCSTLLRLYPLEAGVDPDFSVDPEEEALEELFETEWSLWLDGELAEEAPRPRVWRSVLGRAGLEDLESMARALIHPRADLEKARSSPGAAAALQGMAAAAARLKEGRSKPRGRILEFLGWMEGRFSACADAVEGSAPRAPDLPPTLKPPSWPSDWNGEGEEEYKELAKTALSLDPRHERLMRDALRALEPFVLALRERYRAMGWITFDGLLLCARDLLRGHPRVRAELKRRFAAILVDEFQDTDPVQGELLLFLGEEDGSCARRWQETRPAPGKLFVVGDPKQSIYRFRGADIHALQSFTAHLEANGARRCALQTNFRSSPAIIEAVNRVFPALLRSEPGLQAGYIPIRRRPGAPAQGEPPLWIETGPEPGRAAPPSAEEARRSEAEWIARWIAEERGGRPLKDIAVLLRSASPLTLYLEAFQRRGILYVVEGEKRFFATQEVVDALNLLRAIDDPGDKTALAGLLRSPLSGTADRELYRLAREGMLDYGGRGAAVPGGRSCSAPAGGRGRGAAVPGLYAKLRPLHAQAGRLPVADLVRRAFEETGLLELASQAYHHQQTASNLLKLQRIAFAASEKGWTLKEFIARVEESVRTLREEGESPLADERLDAVRVMTIHKAKGLEYPVVFLPNLAGAVPGGAADKSVFSRWSDGAVGLRLPGAGAANAAWALLALEEARKQRAEEARVLYVAMTRPKERLFLLGGAGKASSFSSLLERSGGLERRALGGPVLPPPPPAARRGPDAWELPRPAEFARAWEARRKTESEVLGGRLFLAPSLEEDEGPVRDPRISPRGGGKPGGAGDSRGGARMLGKLCHEVLERWDFSAGTSLEGEGLAEFIERRASSLAGPGDAAKTARECRAILEGFLRTQTARRLARARILGREVPFVHPEGGSVVRGTMDLLYELDGRTVVADYKTEAPASGGGPARTRGYERQGAHYVRAAEAALGIRGVGFEVIRLRAPG